jgi:hypothetical protein
MSDMERDASDGAERQVVGSFVRGHAAALAGGLLVAASAYESFHSDAIALVEGIGIVLLYHYFAHKEQPED